MIDSERTAEVPAKGLPVSETYSLKYSTNAAAAAYDERICQHEDDPVWAVEQRLLCQMIRRHVPDPAAARAVDFACGSGRILKVLQPVVGELAGIDISGAMLERAAARVPGVKLIQADIVAEPQSVPDGLDLVTGFRFLLLAEPPLREACLRVLAGKVKRDTGLLIFNSHGNPWSFRLIAQLRNKILGRKPALPKFSLGDMRALASRCGLEVIGASGVGFVPRTLQAALSPVALVWIEARLAGLPILWRFATNQLYAMRPVSVASER